MFKLVLPEKLNCCPVLVGIPKLGLGLAGRLDNDPDPDAVEFEVVMASIEPPLPRTSFIFVNIYSGYLLLTVLG